MVTTKHVTDGRCRLTEGLVIGQSVLIHRVKDTSVYRLHTVAHVGQGSSDDNAHCIVDVTAFYFVFYSDIVNNLFFVVTVIVFVSHNSLRSKLIVNSLK